MLFHSFHNLKSDKKTALLQSGFIYVLCCAWFLLIRTPGLVRVTPGPTLPFPFGDFRRFRWFPPHFSLNRRTGWISRIRATSSSTTASSLSTAATSSATTASSKSTAATSPATTASSNSTAASSLATTANSKSTAASSPRQLRVVNQQLRVAKKLAHTYFCKAVRKQRAGFPRRFSGIM
jgi:hypothetical protein